MSLDLFVIFATSKAPSGDAWARALAETHAPISFTQPFDPHRDSGFIPMKVNGRASGFYFGIDSYTELAAQSALVASVHLDKPIVYRLNFGGHTDECVAAFLSASVLVSRFNGTAFDPQGNLLVTAQQLREAAAQCTLLPVK